MADRGRPALPVGLGIDDFDAGLFLPLSVVYATTVAGLSLGLAGAVVTAGTVAGLLVPPPAGRLVDRIGPKPVVISAQLVQAVGAFGYLAAHGAGGVLIATVLLAGGRQLFFCALVGLVADAAGEGPKDRPFAVVMMVRSAGFGLGTLTVGVLLGGAGPPGYRVAVVGYGCCLLVAAIVLATLLRVPHRPAPSARPVSVLRDRPFLGLIGVSGLFVLVVDFFLVGTPVFVLDRLPGPAWLPGAMPALHTALTSSLGTFALRCTRRWDRPRGMALGAAGHVLWCAITLAAIAVPHGWLPGNLPAGVVVLALASLVFGPRADALAEASAPAESRGRYLAAFQYAFTGAQVVAPAVAGLFAVSVWLPFAVVVACSVTAALGLRVLVPRLPAGATLPGTSRARRPCPRRRSRGTRCP
ncbi:MFS transporter [Amycolatopsis ultiminotia]|uniref:MFS transporter n=1 Tax=Amycolatopsis ultiminotia TaxID=543629 RepID=A0ABP6UY31_9PSEU